MEQTTSNSQTPEFQPIVANPASTSTGMASASAPMTPNNPSSNNKMVYVLIALCVVIVLMVVGGFWFLANNKQSGMNFSLPAVNSTTTNNTANVTTANGTVIGNVTTVSGTVDFQGYAPAGSYIAISERESPVDTYKDVVTGISAKTGSIPWNWKGARQGINYEMRAELKLSGKSIDESGVSSVSAPASGVTLELVSEQNPPKPQQTQINGTLNVDGYVPTGSTVSVLVKGGGTGYQIVASALAPTDGTTWSWNLAVSGTTYTVKTQLLGPAGSVISSDVPDVITAPSSGVVLAVNSTATPPTPAVVTGGISGTILINGNIPGNAYITLATRLATSSTFNQVASNLAASNGVSWSWTPAQAGVQYDVQAYIWSNNQPYAQSQVLTVTAPSTNDVLTINAQQSLAAPSGNTINVSCNGSQNNLSQATINYNTQTNLNNVQSYNIVVTLASSGQQALNTNLNPQNPSQSQSLTTGYVFTNGATYYAQYGYTTSSGTSGLSPSVQFSCN